MMYLGYIYGVIVGAAIGFFAGIAWGKYRQ